MTAFIVSFFYHMQWAMTSQQLAHTVHDLFLRKLKLRITLLVLGYQCHGVWIEWHHLLSRPTRLWSITTNCSSSSSFITKFWASSWVSGTENMKVDCYYDACKVWWQRPKTTDFCVSLCSVRSHLPCSMFPSAICWIAVGLLRIAFTLWLRFRSAWKLVHFEWTFKTN